MKKTKVTKKQSKSQSSNSSVSVQKLGIVLGALESKIEPGTPARPITCVRTEYCI